MIYSLFEHELDDFRDFFGKDVHGLDREVRLVFEDGVQNCVSWVQHAHDVSRADSDFHLEISDEPFWLDDCSIVDVSRDAMWSDLVNEDVWFRWLGFEHSALVISSFDARVYLTAIGDIIQISRIQPKRLDRLTGLHSN